MARTLFLLLVLANLGYFSWTQGWLADIGMAPARQTEPRRLSQQIRPEALTIIGKSSDGSLSGAPASAARATTASEPAPTTR
ncbi:MAG: hypothetical protein ABI589_08280 [Burkholderiales bacterium]